MSLFFHTYRMVYNKDGSCERIDGMFTLVIARDTDYWLQPLYVYQDGLIDCRGFMDFERFKAKMRTGLVLVRPPEGARIIVSELASFTSTRVDSEGDPEDFIKEVAYQLDSLRGETTTPERCLQALERCEREPSEENRRALAAAYDAVPIRRRRREIERGAVVERRIRSAIGNLPCP
jgi:hypothetical protein